MKVIYRGRFSVFGQLCKGRRHECRSRSRADKPRLSSCSGRDSHASPQPPAEEVLVRCSSYKHEAVRARRGVCVVFEEADVLRVKGSRFVSANEACVCVGLLAR